MERSKDLLTSTQALAIHWATGYFSVHADAPFKKIGCGLLNDRPDGPARPIAYWPGALNNKKGGLKSTYFR